MYSALITSSGLCTEFGPTALLRQKGGILADACCVLGGVPYRPTQLGSSCSTAGWEAGEGLSQCLRERSCHGLTILADRQGRARCSRDTSSPGSKQHLQTQRDLIWGKGCSLECLVSTYQGKALAPRLQAGNEEAGNAWAGCR